MGSQVFIGTVRLGLFVEEHPGDKDKVLVIHSKSNAGALRRTQIFSKQDGQFAWCGVTRIDGRMMAGSTNGPDPLALLQAISWLETRLEGGLPWRATDIQTEANEEGYKRDTL